MKGLSETAQTRLDHLVEKFAIRECDALSAIVGELPLDHLESLVRTARHPNPTKARPKKYTRRVEVSDMRVRQSKYGFADMELGRRYTLECDQQTSVDYPIQAARRYALRMGYEFWYERVSGARAVRVCFTRKEVQLGI